MKAKPPSKIKTPTARVGRKTTAVAGSVRAQPKTVSAAAQKAHSTRPPKVVSPSPTPAPDNSARDSKQARLIALLSSKPGATIDQMKELTGWQAHTVRGTISGVLRKRLGLTVTCESSADSGGRLYRIVGSAARA